MVSVLPGLKKYDAMADDRWERFMGVQMAQQKLRKDREISFHLTSQSVIINYVWGSIGISPNINILGK